VDTTELAFAGIARQADAIRDGSVSSSELVELCLERIARLDPELNAFRTVFADRARAEAAQADARRKAGDDRPLLGVPVAVKDNLNVAGEVTAMGTNAYGGPASEDSEVVRRLRAAGAVVIGKTHMSELAIFPFTETVAWGQTRNPWDRGRSAGGSSGGSGTAVAAGLVGAAYASDGGGSIRIPASVAGLFGLKPQRGRISTAPDLDPARGMAVYGPLARHVADAARLADALTDGGPALTEAAAAPPRPLRIALSIGVAPGLGVHADAEQLAGVQVIADALRELGHDVTTQELDWDLLLGNRVLARFMRAIADKAAEVGHRERLSKRARGLAAIGSLVPGPLADAAGRASAADAERLNRIFDQADVVLTPMFTRRPPRIREFERRGGMSTLIGMVRLAPYAGAFNHTGQPAAAVPAGFAADGFPLSAQLVGPPDSEALLVAVAAQLEKHTGWPAHTPRAAA
jgi:amidase